MRHVQHEPGIQLRSNTPQRLRPARRGARRTRNIMRLGTVILIIWLIIGAIAAGQRNYYNHMPSCGGTGTTVVTILAGPLNYLGVNPKLSCH
jgi:hypothetical protein